MLLHTIDRGPPKKTVRPKKRPNQGAPARASAKLPSNLPSSMFPLGAWPRMPVTRPLPTATQLQGRLDALAARLGAAGSAITVEVTADEAVWATAQGVTFPNGVPVGKIVVSTRLLRLLTDAELEFVLAHELAHIWRNHLLATASFVVVRAILEDEAKRDPSLRGLLLLWDIFKVGLFANGELPPDAASLKANEEEADLWAVSLTRNRDAAHSALKKLVGGDLSAPSHTWEVFKTEVPAMTVRQRLASLDANLRWNGML